jgi:hypothetical protein
MKEVGDSRWIERASTWLGYSEKRSRDGSLFVLAILIVYFHQILAYLKRSNKNNGRSYGAFVLTLPCFLVAAVQVVQQCFIQNEHQQ